VRFILLDRVIALEPGHSIHAVKTMSADEELFLDHFPAFPVVPGVLLVEMMAQAAGKCLHSGDPDRGLAMLGKINSATFRDWVEPDQLLDIFANIMNSRPRFATAVCRIMVGAQLRASAELLFGFVPRNRLAAEYRDPVLDEFMGRSPGSTTSGSEAQP
jgi:3-hydroxymyristoyl/3-hydroxydecanoyl-(acyl carrier protein) dehydratase